MEHRSLRDSWSVGVPPTSSDLSEKAEFVFSFCFLEPLPR